LRRVALEELQRAVVERLDRRAPLEARLADLADQRPREGLGAHGLVGVRRQQLGLDVEAHLGLAGEREQVAQPGNARAVQRLLVGEALRVFTAGADSPYVILLELFKS